MDSVVSLLLDWQGLGRRWEPTRLTRRLPLLAGLLLLSLFTVLPFLSRPGLVLLLLGSGLLWLSWSLLESPGAMGAMGRWLLVFLAVAVVATGFSPVPREALRGLLKLVLYLGGWALAARLLAHRRRWWNPLLAGLLLGGLAEAVLALRQLHGGAMALATWSDTASILLNTERLYGTLGNPNLLGGYLVPIVPLAVGAALHWRRWPSRLFAAVTATLAGTALVLTYSRGAWLGLAAGLACFALLWVWFALPRRQGRRQAVFWGLLLAAALLGGVAMAGLLEPLQVRLLSALAGRGDSSVNFRINVWTAAWQMLRDYPWTGIGPGQDAFNRVYPLYQQPLFNALSAYSMPLELAVELGVAGLLAGIAVFCHALHQGLRQLKAAVATTEERGWPQISVMAAVVGLGAHGLVDTIFLRPEVQLTWWLCIAFLATPHQPHRLQAKTHGDRGAGATTAPD
ncbi:MAG: putative bicarbonate transporter, IctB family [Synechococcus sp. SB0666_bin_14]|nr:putative bicarbonate transporter, IctB family [Synechococcus sp. SB0666_bin_14]MYA91777.1 putative bicarbonate transporter, IctB family [Synechococcus sp. SB0663_bin_10]MYG47748.1 putative bicarbonate transporter, IctB family [Synechococcus sp. SB0675_bin_6]MYJ60513.1 putative bicarbonate transporter, IctB family [Synechococcus sp. SB0672_bin_6]MYK90883.1 putative bicarbonate transporter, IctB family [Synechococcus sp. SB0669_bin_8]